MDFFDPRLFFKAAAATTLLCLTSPSLYATSLTVDTPGDSNVATGGFFAGTSGDLRGVLNYINENPGNYDVSFALGSSRTITLGAMLPILNLNAANILSLDGINGGSPIILDGNSTYRGFFAQ